jgi:hypothetical protein
MIMISLIRKEKTMWLWMHFHKNMKMKDPFFLFHSLYHIGSKPFSRNGYKIPKSSQFIQQLQSNAPASPGYSWLHEELRYKVHLYLSKQSKLKSMVLVELHATPIAGHSGFTKTYDRVKRSFFWVGMK